MESRLLPHRRPWGGHSLPVIGLFNQLKKVSVSLYEMSLFQAQSPLIGASSRLDLCRGQPWDCEDE